MPEESPESAAVSCPECGGDVCVLHDTKQHWSHRSRLKATGFWFVLTVSMVGYWASVGDWGFRSFPLELREQIGSEFRFELVPTIYENSLELPALSYEDLELASKSDPESTQRTIQAIQTILDYVENNARGVGLLGMKFGFHDAIGYFENHTPYRFGGSLVAIETSRSVSDIRSPLLSEFKGDHDWSKTTVDFFPAFMHTKLQTNTIEGAHNESIVKVQYFTILSVISGCMVVAWSLRWIGMRARVRFFYKRFIWTWIVLILCGLCAIETVRSSENEYYHSTGSSSRTEHSELYSLQQIRMLVENPDALAEWCSEIIALERVQEQTDPSAAMLLGQLWVFDETVPNSTYQAQGKGLFMDIGYDFPLLDIYQLDFSEEVDEQQLNYIQRYWYQYLMRDLGISIYDFGPARKPVVIQISYLRIILLGVSFYWGWVFLQWISRLILARIQKHRLRRGLCIFCRYPLTEEGRNARSAAGTT